MQPIRFKMVDLPDPEGPEIDAKSPFSMSRVIPLSACTWVAPRG